jgi:hypothetical protein
MRSTIALVSAYTLSGEMGASSVTGTVVGVPLTEQLDENTISLHAGCQHRPRPGRPSRRRC